MIERTYSLHEMQALRDWMATNNDDIEYSVRFFLAENKPNCTDPLFWAGWAQKMIANHDFPENYFKRFSSTPNFHALIKTKKYETIPENVPLPRR